MISYSAQVESLEDIFPYLKNENILKDIVVCPNQVNKEDDMGNIDYDSVEVDNLRIFSELINEHLKARDLSKFGGLATRRDRLKHALITENVYYYMKDILENKNKKDNTDTPAVITLEQAIPCVLHMENRVGEKLIRMLLINGLEERSDLEEGAITTFLNEFANIINTEILGTSSKPSHYRIPRDADNSRLIGEINLDNKRTREIINGLVPLINFSILNDGKRESWLKCRDLWSETIRILRQKDDFSDKEIIEFQVVADKFFLEWIMLHKRDGVTNYIHMIGAGHVSYYLKKWRNLYRYSQQGWESLNSAVKTVYFRRSQRGGHGGKERNTSKIMPIAKWVQRLLLWKSGYTCVE